MRRGLGTAPAAALMGGVFVAAADTGDAVPPRPEFSLDSSALCAEVDAARTQTWDERVDVRLELIASACALPVDDVTAADAEAALGAHAIALVQNGEALTLFARARTGEPLLCCSISRARWRLLDGDLWAARWRLEDLDRALLSFEAHVEPGAPAPQDASVLTWRGAAAPPRPTLAGALRGVVSEHVVASPQLGETRRVMVYTPPAHHRGGAYPVLVTADGDGVERTARLIEPLISAGRVRPLVIVGIASGRSAIVERRPEIDYDVRAADYLPFLTEDDRFERHLAWVTETVLPWASAEFGLADARASRAVAGASNGGVFALHAGLRRPDLFGHAFAMSPGMGGDLDMSAAGASRASFRISAGLYEPNFRRAAMRAAAGLRDAGYEVEATYPPAGHAHDQWEMVLLTHLHAVFPAEPATAAGR